MGFDGFEMCFIMFYRFLTVLLVTIYQFFGGSKSLAAECAW